MSAPSPSSKSGSFASNGTSFDGRASSDSGFAGTSSRPSQSLGPRQAKAHVRAQASTRETTAFDGSRADSPSLKQEAADARAAVEASITFDPSRTLSGIHGAPEPALDDLLDFNWPVALDAASVAFDADGVAEEPATADVIDRGAVAAGQEITTSESASAEMSPSSRQDGRSTMPRQASLQQAVLKAGVKRKAEAEKAEAAARASKAAEAIRDSETADKRVHTENSPAASSSRTPVPATDRPSSTTPTPAGHSPAAGEAANESRHHGSSNTSAVSPTSEQATSAPPTDKSRQVFSDIPKLLPHDQVFPIQIGSELFQLSGASISSDAPSYFSQFFGQQLFGRGDQVANVRTLYIDRDPVTFRDISRHLQGYRVTPTDGSHYVKLFADAQFYYLPRLISQLFESDIFIQIGDRNFQIPRDIFSSPGDSPNFFTLGFALFFAAPEDVFPGLQREGLLRPPSIVPPSVPHRSAAVFEQLLHLLRGYSLTIRDDQHRSELLRDCRYYQFKGLEQKIIAHDISYNLERSRTEIVMRLEDIRQSGISFVNETAPSDRGPTAGWVNYSRPFVDETSHELVLEIGGENTKLNLQSMRAVFQGQTNARVSSLFQVIANKMNLPNQQPLGLLMLKGSAGRPSVSPGNTPLSEDQVKVRIGRDAHIVLDGAGWPSDRLSDYEGSSNLAEAGAGETTDESTGDGQGISPHLPASPQRRVRRGSLDDFGEWVLRRSQWRLRVQPKADAQGKPGGMEVVLVAIKMDALSGEWSRNQRRSFLNV